MIAILWLLIICFFIILLSIINTDLPGFLLGCSLLSVPLLLFFYFPPYSMIIISMLASFICYCLALPNLKRENSDLLIPENEGRYRGFTNVLIAISPKVGEKKETGSNPIIEWFKEISAGKELSLYFGVPTIIISFLIGLYLYPNEIIKYSLPILALTVGTMIGICAYFTDELSSVIFGLSLSICGIIGAVALMTGNSGELWHWTVILIVVSLISLLLGRYWDDEITTGVTLVFLVISASALVIWGVTQIDWNWLVPYTLPLICLICGVFISIFAFFINDEVSGIAIGVILTFLSITGLIAVARGRIGAPWQWGLILMIIGFVSLLIAYFFDDDLEDTIGGWLGGCIGFGLLAIYIIWEVALIDWSWLVAYWLPISILALSLATVVSTRSKGEEVSGYVLAALTTSLGIIAVVMGNSGGLQYWVTVLMVIGFASVPLSKIIDGDFDTIGAFFGAIIGLAMLLALCFWGLTSLDWSGLAPYALPLSGLACGILITLAALIKEDEVSGTLYGILLSTLSIVGLMAIVVSSVGNIWQWGVALMVISLVSYFTGHIFDDDRDESIGIWISGIIGWGLLVIYLTWGLTFVNWVAVNSALGAIFIPVGGFIVRYFLPIIVLLTGVGLISFSASSDNDEVSGIVLGIMVTILGLAGWIAVWQNSTGEPMWWLVALWVIGVVGLCWGEAQEEDVSARAGGFITFVIGFGLIFGSPLLFWTYIIALTIGFVVSISLKLTWAWICGPIGGFILLAIAVPHLEVILRYALSIVGVLVLIIIVVFIGYALKTVIPFSLPIPPGPNTRNIDSLGTPLKKSKHDLRSENFYRLCKEVIRLREKGEVDIAIDKLEKAEELMEIIVTTDPNKKQAMLEKIIEANPFTARGD